MTTKIFNIIGWLGMAMIFAVAGIRLFGSAELNQFAYYLTWAGLVCMLIYIGSQWREFADMFSRRSARYGTLAASSVLIVLGILIAVNYIGQRQKKRWDFTAAQQYSLSDQTRNVLAKLDDTLNVQVFAVQETAQPYRDRFEEYAAASRHVQVEYIDPERDPIRSRQAEVDRNGTIVVSYKGRTERTTANTEQDVTNAIIKAVSGEVKKIYFTRGHNEHDPDSTDERNGYSAIKGMLERENYSVASVVPAQGPIPDDAALVIVAGPRTDFERPEIDALKAYLDKAGKLLLMLDPQDRPDAPELTNLVALAREYGIDVGNNIVVDASPMGQMFGLSALAPVAANYPSHPITERFNLLTAYPLARSVGSLSPPLEGKTALAIVEAGPQSWAETDLKGLMGGTQPTADEEAGDRRGPISLAAAVSAASTAPAAPDAPADAPTPETRLAVFGDSDFVANGFLGVQGNRDMFMNTLGWLSQQENLIAIRPREADDRRLTMTAQQQVTLNWFALAVLPLVIFGTGVYSWWRRR
jgi:ABC-type uncharacterized transport system involved in gliding motility auxiliary subunit